MPLIYTAPYRSSSTGFPNLLEGWTPAWTQKVDKVNQTSGYTYDIDDYLIQGATEAAIAYFDSTQPLPIVPYEMFTFPMPDDWKQTHPFNRRQVDLPVNTTSIDTGLTISGTLRYGLDAFTAYITDPWSSKTSWGRIGITGTAAPFYNGFAITTNYATRSDERYSTRVSSATRRFIILVR